MAQDAIQTVDWSGVIDVSTNGSPVKITRKYATGNKLRNVTGSAVTIYLNFDQTNVRPSQFNASAFTPTSPDNPTANTNAANGKAILANTESMDLPDNVTWFTAITSAGTGKLQVTSS